MNQKSKVPTLLLMGVAIASFAFGAAAQQDGFIPAEDNQGLVLFGGYSNTGTELADTWVWNGKNWKQQFPANRPPARESASMTYDKARHEVVLFGGANRTTLSSDTWVWDGKDWREKHPAHVPPARSFAGMAYDGAHEVIVLFGGFEASSFGNGKADTWVWNGDDWEQKFPATSPSARAVINSMTYDPAIGKIVLFSGLEAGAHFSDSDTWHWDGDNWELQRPSVHPNATFGGFSAAYAGDERKVVAFGKSYIAGSVVSVTWLWDGESWTRELPADNPPDAGTLAYDRFDRKLFLLDSGAGMWSWNGKNWRQLFRTVNPPVCRNFALSSGPRTETEDFEDARDDSAEAEGPID